MFNREDRTWKSLGTIATLLTLTAALALSGCSTATKEPQAAPAMTEGGGETKNFVALNWYLRKPIDNLKDQDAVEAEVNKIIKDKVNASLKVNFIDSAGWEDKMKVMSAAGEPYDLVFTSHWTNRLDLNVQKGAFLPLNELLDKYGPDIKKKVDPRAWASATYNGKIYAIPAQSPFSQPASFVFKKELADKYKFDYKQVKQLADLEPYLETIKKNEPNVIPLLAVANSGVTGVFPFEYQLLTNGIRYDEKSGKVVRETSVEAIMNNYRKVNDFYKKGYIAKDAAVKTDFTAEAKSGRYAVLKDSGGYTEDGSKSTALFGYPTVESLYGYPIIMTGNMIGAATAISKTSKNPERAMMLLNEIWKNPVLSNTLAYGLEDKNYTIKSGKGTDNPVIEAKSGAEQTWAIWHNWLGPLWDQWDSNWNSKKSLEQMRKNNDSAQTSSILGFMFDTEKIKTEIAQVNAVNSEITPIMNTGSMTDFDKYIEEVKKKMDNAGIEKVVAEAQRQIDEWKKK